MSGKYTEYPVDLDNFNMVQFIMWTRKFKSVFISSSTFTMLVGNDKFVELWRPDHYRESPVPLEAPHRLGELGGVPVFSDGYLDHRRISGRIFGCIDTRVTEVPHEVAGLQERVFAICHEKKQIMAVGHTSWAPAELTVQERLERYAPGQEKGRAQHKFIMDNFGNVDELLVESAALVLKYKRVPGYWEGGGVA